MKKVWLLPLSLAVGAFALVPATTAVAADDAKVVVVHGIPATPVDVYVNDKLTLDDFKYGTVTDPLSLPAGSYALAVRPAGAAASSAPILEADAAVKAGDNVSIVAHLKADGKPTLTIFANDVSKTSPGEGRLIVRHTAAAPAVDVLAGGQAVFSDLTNPKEAKADLPAGTVSASVALAGTTKPVIGPADVPVTEGAATIVYATGSAADGNLAVQVQTIDGLHSSPSSVDTGNSPLPSEGSSGGGLFAALAIGAVAAAGITAFVVRRRQTA